jgi:predicted metalloprotease
LSFFNELTQRLGAHGDFTFAYVISHEVGYYIQHILGTTTKIRQLQSRKDESGSNKLSVAMDLQADFYAGVWAHYNEALHNTLEEGDIEEALSAANAVGDDRLQKQAQGYVVPDAFTHGTSEQRMYWFKKGYETGDLRQGNTFDEL